MDDQPHDNLLLVNDRGLNVAKDSFHSNTFTLNGKTALIALIHSNPRSVVGQWLVPLGGWSGLGQRAYLVGRLIFYLRNLARRSTPV